MPLSELLKKIFFCSTLPTVLNRLLWKKYVSVVDMLPTELVQLYQYSEPTIMC